jgi:hypothetical protein
MEIVFQAYKVSLIKAYKVISRQFEFCKSKYPRSKLLPPWKITEA